MNGLIHVIPSFCRSHYLRRVLLYFMKDFLHSVPDVNHVKFVHNSLSRGPLSAQAIIIKTYLAHYSVNDVHCVCTEIFLSGVLWGIGQHQVFLK